MNKYYCANNEELEKIPANTTHLTFGCNFDQPVDNLPNSITHITFGYNFNQPVDNLPNSIIHLTFGFHFNQSVNNLPNSIIHLTFRFYFNKPVDNLPCSITHLTFGRDFNQSVDNLPHSITHLSFGCNFNQSISKLPHSIIYLKLGYLFKHQIDDVINFVKIFNFSDNNNNIYHRYKEKLNNKQIVFYSKNYYVYYKFNNFNYCDVFSCDYNVRVRNIAELQYFTHNILLKKLTEYVFNPQRLLRIVEKYNLTIEEYMDFL